MTHGCRVSHAPRIEVCSALSNDGEARVSRKVNVDYRHLGHLQPSSSETRTHHGMENASSMTGEDDRAMGTLKF